MTEQKQTGWDAIATRIFEIVALLFVLTSKLVWEGIRNVNWKSVWSYIGFMYLFGILGVLVNRDMDLYLMAVNLPDWMLRLFFERLPQVPFWTRYEWESLFAAWILFLVLGIRPWMRRKRFQRELDRSGLKNGLGELPSIVSVTNDPPFRMRLRVKSAGVGVDKFEARRSDLEASFGMVIEGIKALPNTRFIEITLAKRKIPEKARFMDLVSQVAEPYSFIVGESMGGLIVRCILALPHLLIAGTTGGGKSVFFKQVLLCLLKVSHRIQFYLLDLKKGVEVKEFEQLPNCVIAKTESDAVKMLDALKIEMDRRFKYLEEHGYKSIRPERDKMDIIVVAVDEASVLYTQSKRRGPEADLTGQARELTDNIAKLGRAAGIHLILATQKVTKETIDTKIQENIGGRMCFRMNTLQGSMTVLGNKMAYELPDKPGRAIWASGNDFIEVQAPLLTDEELNEECQAIANEYKDGKRAFYGPILQVKMTPQPKPKDMKSLGLPEE